MAGRGSSLLQRRVDAEDCELEGGEVQKELSRLSRESVRKAMVFQPLDGTPPTNFPTTPYVYVLYTYDHELGSAAAPPRWGTPGVLSDPCPTPPGATGDGCVVSGRLSRLRAAGNFMTGAEQVLIEDWCQQYPSHSVGAMVFG